MPQPTPNPATLRDRLANERTFLAWLRTSLALMAFGVALAKFALFLNLAVLQSVAAGNGLPEGLPSPGSSRAVALGLIASGGIIALLGTWRTRAYARTIGPHPEGPTDTSIAWVAALSVLLSVLLIVYLLVG